MSATRVFIIVLVLIAVLFGVALAVAHHKEASSRSVTELIDEWKATFQNLGRMNPEDVVCAQRKNTTITFSAGVPVVQATIKRDPRNRVRRLNLNLTGTGAVKLKFAPDPGDDRATTNEMDLQLGKTNTLAVFAPGGTLTLTRVPLAAPATIEIR